MLRIAIQDVSPRGSVKEEPRGSFSLPFSPLTIIDGLARRSFSYGKMWEGPLKLSVLKLDGSSFDVEVMKTFTIGELMMAVEDVFFHVPKISWPHVWGHFCLNYKGQNLLTETDYISDYDIEDGDQIHFVRHISSKCILTKRQSKKRIFSSVQTIWSLLESRNLVENEHKAQGDCSCDDIENGKFQYNSKDKEVVACGGYNNNDKDREMVAMLRYDEKMGKFLLTGDVVLVVFPEAESQAHQGCQLQNEGKRNDSSRFGLGFLSSFRKGL